MFPIDLIEKIFSKKKSATDFSNVTDQSNKQDDGKPSLDNLEQGQGGVDFTKNLTNFLMSTKQKPTREEKIDKADRLGLV